MTDEEMAEEYAKLNARQYKHNDNTGFCTSEEEVEKAFLAGLKAGKPKWHKVADGDLPKDMENVIINALDYGINTCYVAHRLNGGWRSNCSSEVFAFVIAWKEIVLPKEIKE